MSENELSNVIIGAAIEVHRELGGPGLLEDVYEEALCHELQLRGLEVQRQVGVAIEYKGKDKSAIGAIDGTIVLGADAFLKAGS